ncbi:MAG: phospho-N-acetylmuramoyl-pentapeptide-transferase [Clostridia bacterium]|nr:phospho-N-acetylmuramoyl-pentapeptide-transferase [Clostridia bacterium]
MNFVQTALWVGAAMVAFVVSERLCKALIPLLHRLKFGQTIREEGPTWHKAKQGTPTMGGLAFIGAALTVGVVALLIGEWVSPTSIFEGRYTSFVAVVAGLLLAAAFGAIGFLDDYIKVVKKRNLGLTSRQKLLLQLAAAVMYAVAMYVADATRIYVPFYGMWDAGFWFIPIAVFIITAMTNATNLTDGVDGLCASTAVVVLLFMLVLSRTSAALGIVCAVGAGAIAGFLVWNFHPARVFMGDTGSLFIGALLCAVAFGLGYPLLLLPMGLVYFIETCSVMLQVSYFKLTHGKRLFKMSPIHHHFEMSGWSEKKIVAAACTVTVLGCAAALALTL